MQSFDERAATWDDDPAKVERAAAVAQAIRAAVDLRGDERLLEYGAGTGLVTQALGDAVGSATLADTSSGMRDVMQAKVDAGALPGARVSDVDLAGASARDLGPDERFDLIVTVLTMHHIDAIDLVLFRMAGLLAPDGTLAIVDLDAEDGSFHGEGFGGHHGFDRAEFGAQLEAAGLANVEFRDCGHIDRPDGRFSMFLATARR